MYVSELTDDRLVLRQKTPSGFSCFAWVIMIFLGVPLSLFFGLGTVAIAVGGSTFLECDRAPSASVTCQIRNESRIPLMRSQQTVFEPVSVQAEQVKVVQTHTSRNQRGATSRYSTTDVSYHLTIRTQRDEVRVVTYEYDAHWGLLQIAEAQINAFLSSSSSVPLTLEFPPEKMHSFGPGVLLVIFGGLFLVFPFYLLGTVPTITLTLDKSKNQLTRKVESRGLQTNQRFQLSSIDTVTIQEKTRGKRPSVYQTVLELNNHKIVRTASYATPSRADAEETAKVIRQFLGYPV